MRQLLGGSYHPRCLSRDNRFSLPQKPEVVPDVGPLGEPTPEPNGYAPQMQLGRVDECFGLGQVTSGDVLWSLSDINI